tara:strand:+ start:844 stop:1125 length:282 start_codon:yes stop_codon:yes gene_type:complete
MEFKDNSLLLEMEINGVEAEYEIYFDFNYSPAWIAPNSGTSMAMEPDEDEEYEIYNAQIECVGGLMRDLTDDELAYAMEALEEQAAEIIMIGE